MAATTVPDRTSWCRPTRQPKGNCCCFQPRIPPDRPDPAIYSQDEQFAAGGLPTWNSPDITTNFLSPWTLMPESKVKVRNLSPTASAVGAQVTLYTALFGIGMVRTPLSTMVLNFAPLQEFELLFPLTQALLNASNQNIATFVSIHHPTDRVLINSHGAQQIAEINTAQDGRNATVQFPVLNQSGSARTITLAVLANSVGATIAPVSLFFSPWQQILGNLQIHVPPGMHNTTEEVTVVGWAPDGSVIDGITYIVRVND